MKLIVNLVGKVFGLDKGVEKFEMGKAYFGAISLMLSGLGTICTGLVGILAELEPCHEVACYFAWAKGLGTDTNVALVAAGAAMISKGYTDLGARHATAKLEAKMVKLATDPGPIVIDQRRTP